MQQLFKIVDRDRTETRWQSEWFGKFTLADVIGLTSKFTVAQFLAREDFAKRFKANHPIAITELLYPLLQAYDSVAVESDVEFGGTDQKFNLLVGRDLQEMRGQKPQQCFLMPLLPGTDGVQKMSKSLGNYIGIDEPTNDIYGKTMSLPDQMIVDYFDYLTDVSDSELKEIRQVLDGGSENPMGLKKQLASNLVTQFHDEKAAIAAADHFERTVQHSQMPDDIPVFAMPSQSDLQGKRFSNFLADAGVATSASEARRLIEQGAVQLNGEVVTSNDAVDGLGLKPDDVIRAGRRRYVKLVK